MLKKHKRFERPRKPFDINRIKSENVIVIRYGLKNKREIWKARTKLNSIRRRAKKLVNESLDIQTKFLDKLNKQGYPVKNIVNVLALTEENVLSRRLQSVLLQKKLATTAKGARQLITHRHVKVNGVIVNIPSYAIDVNEEAKIELVNKGVIVKTKKHANIENPEPNLEVAPTA